MGKLRTKLVHAWNAFRNNEEQVDRIHSYNVGWSTSSRPDKLYLRLNNERTILTSILTKLAMDAASIALRHAKTDKDGVYQEDIQSGLNNCLTVEANLDQAATHFRQNIFSMLLTKGVCGILPVDTDLNPEKTGGYNILTMRVAEVVGWAPEMVTLKAYDQRNGRTEQLEVPKNTVGIVENPLYDVMNEPNSTLQRLIKKLSLLDISDDRISSGKLDLIIQLPYVIKSDARRQQAEQRRKDIEFQLKGSTYGIAYTDGTEKITQLNRPAENNLLEQIENLKNELFAQLGITQSIMDGTADEKTMLNYRNRTIEPLVTAVVEAMRRTFLTKTARTQGQTILYFYNTFKFVPLTEMAEIADKFTRNEIMSANELRGAIGFKPSKDPKADELRNSNMPAPEPPPPPTPEPAPPEQNPTDEEELGGDSQNGS